MVSRLPELLSASQAAAMLGMTTPTFYKRVSDGIIPVIDLGAGTRMRFSRRQLIAWLESPSATRRPRAKLDPDALLTDLFAADSPRSRPAAGELIRSGSRRGGSS